jgi:hypothetical protein
MDFTDLAGAEDLSAEDDDITLEDFPEEEEIAPDEPVKKEAAANPDTAGLSTQLLLRIAEELSSIRSELSGLKKDFAVLKTDPAEKAGEGEYEHEHPHKNEDDEEEDDEKIALTGDELNNILNTADFTEETGTDATGDEISLHGETQDKAGEDSETFSINDLDGGLDLNMELGENDLDELDGEFNPAAIDIETDIETDIDIDTDSETAAGEDILVKEEELLNLGFSGADDETSLPDFDIEAGDELLQLREEGAHPMTPAPEPEDASYLVDDPLADETFENEAAGESDDDMLAEEITIDDSFLDEASLDLSDAVIDEPDLSMEIQDNPIEEPSLEHLSIELEDELPESEDDGLALIPEGFIIDSDSRDQGEEEIILPEALPEDRVEEIPDSEPEIINIDDLLEEEIPQEIPEAKPQAVVNTVKEVIPTHLKTELKTVLTYMDKLLESLPDRKIEEFAKSEFFDTYKKLFRELGLV